MAKITPIWVDGWSGLVGATGARGFTGAPGLSIRGETGAQGSRGLQGVQGPRGKDGLDGRPGATGETGAPGPGTASLQDAYDVGPSKILANKGPLRISTSDEFSLVSVGGGIDAGTRLSVGAGTDVRETHSVVSSYGSTSMASGAIVLGGAGNHAGATGSLVFGFDGKSRHSGSMVQGAGSFDNHTGHAQFTKLALRGVATDSGPAVLRTIDGKLPELLPSMAYSVQVFMTGVVSQVEHEHGGQYIPGVSAEGEYLGAVVAREYRAIVSVSETGQARLAGVLALGGVLEDDPLVGVETFVGVTGMSLLLTGSCPELTEVRWLAEVTLAQIGF